MPQDFVDYLLADGIVLPAGSYVEPKCDVNLENNDDDSDVRDNDDEVDWSTAETHEAEAPSFPELEDKIKFYIDELGGSVFPKLNWSSPKDAKWISATHTLQCNSIGEVILLLKSSDFIAHDLTQPFKNCADWKPDDSDHSPPYISYELVLKKWVDVNPGSEFRCFVKDDCLIAICQRDHCNFYEYIVTRTIPIVNDIVSFFREKVQGRFPSRNYVFDVHQVTKDFVELIDFNPFGVTTDALFFDWDELVHWNVDPNKEPEFRCVTSYSGIQPSPYRYYAMPVDFLDISTGQDPYKMRDLLQLMNGSVEKEPYSESSSENEDEGEVEEEADVDADETAGNDCPTPDVTTS